jgi:hypothetical protein
MKTIQKQYELKSRLFNNSQEMDLNDYFRYIDLIRNRPNQYSIPTERNVIKKIIYQPYKDPNVIEANRRHKLNLYNKYKEPALPKLNNIYLEVREILKNNKDRYREIAERALSFENTKFQDRAFSQKPRIIENYYYRKIPNLKKSSNNRDSESEYRKSSRKSSHLRLPSINKHKEEKYEKLFQTEVNTTRDINDNEQSGDNTINMKDHKYKDISHLKQGHIEG